MYLNTKEASLDPTNSSLTITWDVFEFICHAFLPRDVTGLTITWDVFEFSPFLFMIFSCWV